MPVKRASARTGEKGKKRYRERSEAGAPCVGEAARNASARRSGHAREDQHKVASKDPNLC